MIEIRNLYKTFDKVQVLNGLNLSVRDGETKVIIGRSGAGKSVLLKCIVGLLRPDAGSIKVEGKEVVGLAEHDFGPIRKDIGLVFQGGALFDSMNVGENISFFLDEFTKLSTKEKHERVAHALSLVGLKDIEHLMPSQLSGGMKKRVSLARVLAGRLFRTTTALAVAIRTGLPGELGTDERGRPDHGGCDQQSHHRDARPAQGDLHRGHARHACCQ